MAKKITPKFNCSQMDFISAAKTAWQNFLLYITVFTAFKPFYKASTAADAIKALDDAKKMPDVKQRNEKSERARKGLITLNDTCTDLFQRLKLYIDTAGYQDDELHILYESAGQSYYNGAVGYDWESTSMMLNNMVEFIDGHKTELEANDNMPSDFNATVKDGQEDFDTLYENFKVFSETGVATAAKIKALNASYKTMNTMLNDGKRLFINDEEVQELFVFTSILDKLNSAKAALAGAVTDETTDAAVPGVIMTVKYENEPAFDVVLNEDSTFNKEMKGGKATVIFMANEYEVVTKVVNIQTGTTMRLDVKMKKAA